MQITGVKLYETQDVGKVKAYGSITIDGEFAVTGIRVVESNSGLFVSMPSRKTQSGEYKDVCFPVTRDAREQIQNTVLKEYKKMAGNYSNNSSIEEGFMPIEADEDLPF